MRTLTASLCLAALFSAAGVCQAQTPARPGRMTVELRQVPLRRSLALVLQGTGVQCDVDSAVPDVLITLDLHDVPLRTAVKRIVGSAGSIQPGLAVDFSGASWRVVRGTAHPRAFRGPNTKVALDVMDVSLREAIDRLFAETDSFCAVDANVPDVPVSVKFQNVSLDSGMWLVLGAAWSKGVPLGLKRSGANYQMSVTRLGPAYELASRHLAPPAHPKRADMKLYYVPIREAVKIIPALPGTRVVVDRSVPDVRLRMRLRNLRPDTAVSQVVAVSSLRVPGITYVRSGNVYVIYRPTAPAHDTARTAARE
jgi:hypothetical protein